MTIRIELVRNLISYADFDCNRLSSMKLLFSKVVTPIAHRLALL